MMIKLNKTFILLLLTLSTIIILLSNLELWISKRNCTIVIPSGEDKYVLMPDETGFIDPIYIYNSKNIKKKDLRFEIGYNEKWYIEKNIDEHIASKISSPLEDLYYIMKNSTNYGMPINNIYRALGKGGEFINKVDPLSYEEDDDYKLITSKKDNAFAFIAKGLIYVKK